MASAEKSLSGKKPEKKSKKKSSKKHKIKRTIIEHADNGGHIVRHEFQPEEPDSDDAGGAMPMQQPPDQTAAVSDKAALMDHLNQNIPDDGSMQGGGMPMQGQDQGQ